MEREITLDIEGNNLNEKRKKCGITRNEIGTISRTMANTMTNIRRIIMANNPKIIPTTLRSPD